MNTLNYNDEVINLCKNVSNLCRLCLSDSSLREFLHTPLEEIFDDDVTTLYHIMEKLSSTKLSDDPRYPAYVCVNCASLLNTAYQVNKLLELSQTRLSKLFNDNVQLKNPNTNVDSCGVEIISDKGRYNLKDIIIEENEEQTLNYNGFLKNLGSVISAEFVSNGNDVKKKHENDKIHFVNLIPLTKVAENPVTSNDISDTAIELKEKEPVSNVQNPKKKIKGPINCNQCGKTFKSRGSLFRHKEIHTPVRSYLCQVCGYVAKRHSEFTSHMLLVHLGNKFPCEECGKKYRSKSHLECHMAVHKNERLQLCTVCGKSFNYTSSLEYHMRVHTGEKRFKCTYCDRAFSMRGGLNRHLRTHTGLRPYKCSFCDRAFRSSGEVKCHEMIHTGYRPYHCKLCGKGFTKTHNLKMHMLSHAGPILCQFCQKGFMDTTNLQLHMKMQHGLHDYVLEEGEEIVIVQEEDVELEDFNETLILTTE